MTERKFEDPKNLDAKGSIESLMKCNYCKKDLEKFFTFGPIYCPFCGAVISGNTIAGHKDSNTLVGRALWPLKWSILGVFIGMTLLFIATFVIEFVIILIIFSLHSTADIDQIMNIALNVLLSPTMTAIISLIELVLVVPAFAITRKYRKSIKERFQLLGWRSYRTSRSLKTMAWKRFFKELGYALIIALALVGFQFITIITNDAIWTPIIPGGSEALEGSDQGIMASNFFQFTLLVAAMMLIIGPTEEILFRGLSQQGLEARIGERRAWIISALIFTFVHVLGGLIEISTFPFLFFPYLYLSLALCGIYTKTKNLNLMIFIHGFYDSLLVLYSYLYFEFDQIGIGWAADIFVYIAFAVFAGFGLIVFFKWLIPRVKKRMVTTNGINHQQ